MEILDLRHVMIVCAARTGGTWLGKLFDAEPTVKYVWEPDLNRFHSGKDNFAAWNFDDGGEIWARVKLHRPHVDISPSFPTDAFVKFAVYKLIGPIGHGDLPDKNRWTDSRFERIRHKLGARVIHLVRHPVRWWASVQRWKKDAVDPVACVKSYLKANLHFWSTHRRMEWYCIVHHEEVVAATTTWLEGKVYDLGIAPELGPTARRFVADCHSKDQDPHPDHHSCIMTKDTVLYRWKDLPVHTVQDINDVISHVPEALEMFGTLGIGG